MIFIVTAPSVGEAALDEVLDRARKGQRTICRKAEEIAELYRPGRGDAPPVEKGADVTAEAAAAESGANDSETADAEDSPDTVVADDGETKTEDAKGKSDTEDPADADNAEEEFVADDKADSSPEVFGDPEAGTNDETGGQPEPEDGEDEPEAEDGGDQPEPEAGEDEPEAEAGEDEQANRLLAAFESAISEAEESFFDMDKQTKQEALERARENHSDFLSEIAALAA